MTFIFLNRVIICHSSEYLKDESSIEHWDELSNFSVRTCFSHGRNMEVVMQGVSV